MATKLNASRIEALKTIAEIHRNEFDRRRKYEWNVFFTTLGVFTSVVIAKFSKVYKWPKNISFNIGIPFFFFVLAVISSIYLVSVHRANKVNKGFAEAAENEIMSLLNVTGLKKVSMDIPACLKVNWSLFWQIIVLFLLAIGCSIIIISHPHF